MIYQFSSGGRSVNQFPGGGLGCLIATVLVVVGGYYLLQGLYYLLLWAAPALLVLALIINWRVYPDTIKSWVKGLETNPVGGIVTLALVVLAFPFFSLYMLLKALGYRKMEQFRQQFSGAESRKEEDGFVEFEELESTPKSMPEQEVDPEPLEPQPEPEKRKEQNPYDSLFD